MEASGVIFATAVARGLSILDARADDDFRREALACLDGLHGFAISLCRDVCAAEDLVQETYARAFAARRKAAADENVRAWLFTILHNVWRNDVRRRRPAALEATPGLAESLVSPGANPQELLSRRETEDRVRRAIADLPEAFREVIVLRFEGFSYRDLAHILGCPAGTVMSRLARARALLRQSVLGDEKSHGAA